MHHFRSEEQRLMEMKFRQCVQSYTTMTVEECAFESHLEYFDVQYVVEGEECFGYEPVKNLTPSMDYDAERDLIFYNEPDDAGS